MKNIGLQPRPKILKTTTSTRVFKDLILAMDGSLNAGRVAWSLVDVVKTSDLMDGNSTPANKKLREKHVPHWLHFMVSC